MNISDYAIVCDFDGTITLKDTNDIIFYEYGNAKNRANEDRLAAGKIDYRSATSLHFKLKPLTFEQYYTYLDTHIQIDPGFSFFLQKIRENNLPFYIISGGFRQAITHMLKNYEIPAKSIFANDLIFEKRLIPIYAHDITSCPEILGPCGNCKRVCIETIRKQTDKKIMYIGDGFSDRCAVKLSDHVFAKDTLVDYCETHGIEHIKFTNFNDISTMLGWSK